MVGSVKETEWKARMKIQEDSVMFKLDTGAQANILLMSVFKKMHANKEPHKSNTHLATYSGENIPVVGRSTECIEYTNMMHVVECIIVNVNSQSILGVDTCADMGLIRRIMSLEVDKKEAIIK